MDNVATVASEGRRVLISVATGGVGHMTLSSLSDWCAQPVRAIDGPAGRVRGVYFDDQSWSIRYVVIDTGGWLRSDLRLIKPAALRLMTPTRLLVGGSRAVRRSPSIDWDWPVSAQKLEERRRAAVLRFYASTGLTGYGERANSVGDLPPHVRPGDVHLRSCQL